MHSAIRIVENFPKPGVSFKDINPYLRDNFVECLERIWRRFSVDTWEEVTHIVGIESRGFVLAAGLAAYNQKGFIPIRKKGKLPPPVREVSYNLEYGHDSLEMVPGEGTVLIIDDVIATGGTLVAAINLAEMCGYKVAGAGALVKLLYLNPDSVIKPAYPDIKVESVYDYES